MGGGGSGGGSNSAPVPIAATAMLAEAGRVLPVR